MAALNETNNEVRLCGVLGGRPELSHTSRGENYYVFPMEVTRLSGAIDNVNIMIRESIMEKLQLSDCEKVAVSGELRSFNNKSGTGSKLVITVFAREVWLCDEEDENYVFLYGTLCKRPVYRKTPMGRRICDMMMAVNRRYGRSDYLPCIAWGSEAEKVSLLDVGDKVKLEGRIQSRNYIKNENGVPVERTAFEVSVLSILEDD